MYAQHDGIDMRLTRFTNRTAAGRLLARRLSTYAGRNDVLVLALPRGGVPVAAEVAHELQAPLDVFVVRKLGVPGHRELAFGAIGPGGVRVLNDEVLQEVSIADDQVEAVTAEEARELHRREHVYRGDAPPPRLIGRTVILVDDGLATGATMRAAVVAARRAGAARVVVAVPVAAAESCETLAHEADDVVCVMTPRPLWSIGRWYDDYTQVTDQEVCQLLKWHSCDGLERGGGIMNTRELSPGEWKTFFDAFSRRFQGVPVTVDVCESRDGRAEMVARQLPLLGVTVEPPSGPAESIAIMVGDAPGENVVHVVREPHRVRVAQVSNGEDELLIIDSLSGLTTRIDFRGAKARAKVVVVPASAMSGRTTCSGSRCA